MTKGTEKERPLVSIIIPTFNEELSIGKTLEAVARVQGNVEVIVADGGSDDATIDIARRSEVRVIRTPRGRGMQMRIGASIASGQTLLFLHADTTPPIDAAELIVQALADRALVGGNFILRFDGESRAARFLSWLYPILGRLGLCYGDSGIFVRASTYQKVGGFNSYPIFEDLDLVRRLRRCGRMIHLPAAVITSSRRFEGRSFALTFTRWSVLQALYWMGMPPRVLNQLYAPVRSARIRN